MLLSLEQLRCVLVKLSAPEKQTTKVCSTVPQLHLFTLSWAWQLPSAECYLQGSKKVTSMQSATAMVLLANNPLRLMELRRPSNQCCGKGKKADMVQVNTEEAPPYDELFINAVYCKTIGDTHPEEILIDYVHTLWCNEAYTIVQLPASASSKGTASLYIKVNSGAGGNMLLLHVFECLYPNCISQAGLATGLDHVSTSLTAYNGSHIPLYGALHGTIICQPGSPGTQPCKVNSYWHVADTPNPAILGLPSYKRFAVVKMNCAITVVQPNTNPPSPAPAPTTTAFKPTTGGPCSNQIHQIHWWLD